MLFRSLTSGADRGFYSVPEVNDEVLVIFEHGDITRPIIVGMLWNRQDKIPDAKSKSTTAAVDSGSTNRRGFRSRVGHYLEFDDTSGSEAISLFTQGGHEMSFDDSKKKGMFMKTAGGHELSLDQQGSSIEIKNSAGNKITISDSGAIEVKAIASIKLSAPQITVSADGILSLEGATVKVNGTTIVQIQGALVTIN